MSLPIVAIVGRPNVGKSSILNALVGRRISIVDPTPGVTRDRISSPCPLSSSPDARYVELVDTGGMGIEDRDQLTGHVEAQIEYAIQAAALILFVVDAREGVMPLDKHVADRLRRQKAPVILVANKYDQENLACEIHNFERLGFGLPMRFSAKHSLGHSDLLEAIAARLGDMTGGAPPNTMKLAIVGKRNAGKSTFINSLAGQERVIVSEKPGTTRDSVDVDIDIDGKTFTVIDTAGVQKRKSLAGDIEYYSYHRAMRSIRRADVVALLVDASVPISQVDKDLAGEIAKEYKPVVLVVNKWDLAKSKDLDVDDYEEYFLKTFPELAFAPISLTTATEGINVRQTITLAEQLFAQTNTRVPTARLNEAVQTILESRNPSHKAGTKVPKLLYVSQISVAPPTIVCFVNDVRSFDHQYERFLVNRLRETLPFNEVPVRLVFRQRREKKE